MFTENYKYSDYNQSTEKETFENAPMNLMTDRAKTYLNRDYMRDKLSYTYTKDAKVELFLSKWIVNNKGCIQKIRQSESFALQGKFLGHNGKNLHLELSNDQKYVYITTEYN